LDDDQPFELYGSHIPVSQSIPEQADPLTASPSLKKRDSLVMGPSLTHKQSIT
jgi:hypothetical protein